MSPIEFYWITLTVAFGFIGAARGYPRELGVTTVMLIAILVLKRFGTPLMSLLDKQLGPLLGVQILQQPDSNLIQYLIYTGFFLAVVFAAYAGETLTFRGQPARGGVGMLISIANGLVNGYLINGTLWYYLDKYDYPIQRWDLFKPPLTDLAQEMVRYLPPRVLDTTMLIGLIGILTLLRIRK
ncbi:MAG TPA: hypothetical protein G4O02_12655 [Caldilineae bacterium]|nr:hypothetical protein [Caldilineae bacterium]